MQEINELKQLVVQSLESTGVLSQLRAQIRSSVFKVIDQPENPKSTMFWENPLCQKLHNTQQGRLSILMITELMKKYKMDYSLSVFQNEANIAQLNQSELETKKTQIGVNESTTLIEQLLDLGSNQQQFQQSDQSQHQQVDQYKTQMQELQKTIQDQKQTLQNVQQQNQQLQSQQVQQQQQNSQLQQQIQQLQSQIQDTSSKTTNYKDEHKKEIEKYKKQIQDMEVQFQQEQEQLQQQFEQQMMEQQEMIEQYLQQQKQSDAGDDDQIQIMDQGLKRFEDEVVVHSENDQDHHQNQDGIQEDIINNDSHKLRDDRNSEDQVVNSQSQGFDMSVDSMALEEYDYYEDVIDVK